MSSIMFIYELGVRKLTKSDLACLSLNIRRMFMHYEYISIYTLPIISTRFMISL